MQVRRRCIRQSHTTRQYLQYFLFRLGRALVRLGKKPEEPASAAASSQSSPQLAVINPGVNNLSPTMKTDIANRCVLQALHLRHHFSCIHVQCSLQTAGNHRGLQASVVDTASSEPTARIRVQSLVAAEAVRARFADHLLTLSHHLLLSESSSNS